MSEKESLHTDLFKKNLYIFFRYLSFVNYHLRCYYRFSSKLLFVTYVNKISLLPVTCSKILEARPIYVYIYIELVFLIVVVIRLEKKKFSLKLVIIKSCYLLYLVYFIHCYCIILNTLHFESSKLFSGTVHTLKKKKKKYTYIYTHSCFRCV